MRQSIIALLTASVIAISMITVPAQADSRDYRRDYPRDHQYDRHRDNRRDHQYDRRSDNRRDHQYDRHSGNRRDHRKTVRSPIIHRGHNYSIPSHRVRRHRDIVVVRPYGSLYRGYGHYFHDDDAYKWLAFTAIAVKLLDNLNEQQEREHEAAQVRATTAPIGETIYWREGSASGSVTATREGNSSAGRYCREFQHEVTIGGKREQSYGTACRQPDGSWEVISTGQ